MTKETNSVRKKMRHKGPIDAVDRRILGVLIKDSSTAYSQIGQAVNLSAPAVHERVKRMRENGVIRSTSAQLNPSSIGKPLLAFVLITVEGNEPEEMLAQFERLPEVEEIHAVAGDCCMIMKVRTEGPEALEHLLGLIYVTPKVRSTQSYVVLSTKLERPVQAEIGAYQ